MSGLAAAFPRQDLPGAALLASIFLGLLLVAELWRRFGNPEAEWTRKLVHLGGGIACLFFPFLVRSPWVVLALALPLTAIFAFGKRFGFLKSLHAVKRESRGAEYYPLSVFLVFLLAGDKPWLYLAAVLVLAVADAFAALVGSRYGVIRYEVEEGEKSLEGSLVFLVIAFLAIHLPTLLLTDLPRPVTVLAALLVAALVTGFEAISLEGADNLLVPLAVAVVLRKITSKDLSEVIFQNLSLLAICLVVGVIVWRYRSLNVGGAITFILFAYGAWSLGNWQWALPAFVGFGFYVAAWGARARRRPHLGIKVRAIARALLAPFLWLILANSLRSFDAFYGPYLAASAVVLAVAVPFGTLARAELGDVVQRRGWLASLAGGLVGALVVALPPWAFQAAVPARSLAALVACVILAAMTVAALERRRDDLSPGKSWTAIRFIASLVAAGAVYALQAAGVLAPWLPRTPS